MMKRTLAFVLAVVLANQATLGAVIGTRAAMQLDARAASVAQVQTLLERAEVRDMLVRLGVSPDEAKARVAVLTDAELGTLASRLEALPAGAGVLEVVGIVAVVLIVLELVGVIDIFKKA